MIKNQGWCDPEIALRQLCAEPAASFGAQLLAHSDGTGISFRAFVQVARELVRGSPDDAARWIAAMVALDMFSQERRLGELESKPPGIN